MSLGNPISPGAERIVRERMRHIIEEGYAPEGDVGRSDEITQAALCYIAHADALNQFGVDSTLEEMGYLWPWPPEYWKPGTAERDLEKAGSLCAAAIDALQAEKER